MRNYLIMAMGVLFLAGCATEPDVRYKIAYNVYVDRDTDDYEVFTVNPDGTEPTNITNRPGMEWVYYAYDGKLFFISDRDACPRCYFLYEMDAAGQNVRKISDVRLKDSWLSSRNGGTELIVNPHQSVDSVFYIIDLQGNLLAKVDPDMAYAGDPLFTPDGSQVVFRGSPVPFKMDVGFADELYVINTDGSGRRQLTQFPASDTLADWWEYHAGPPTLAPGGAISFNSVRDGVGGVFRIGLDGAGLERLTPLEEEVGWHAWSPDGAWFVYDVQVPITDSTYTYDLFIRHPGEPVSIHLTTDPRYEQAPVVVAAPAL